MAKTRGSRRHKALIALLIERREAARMTQTQFADRLGEYSRSSRGWKAGSGESMWWSFSNWPRCSGSTQ